MSIDTHPKKRIEIMIEAPALERVTDALDRAQVTGFTVLPALAGRGNGGTWRRDDVFGDSGRIVCVVCIADAQRMPAILEALKPLVERHIGILSVSDVQVIRADHF